MIAKFKTPELAIVEPNFKRKNLIKTSFCIKKVIGRKFFEKIFLKKEP